MSVLCRKGRQRGGVFSWGLWNASYKLGLKLRKTETRNSKRPYVTRPDVIARAAFLTRISKERGQIIVWREWPNIVEKQIDKALGGHDWSAEFCKEVGYPEEQVQAAAAQANVGFSLAEALADSEGPLEKPSWWAVTRRARVIDVPAEPEKGKEEDMPNK